MANVWKNDINYILENASRVDETVVEGCNQWNYYDLYNNLIMKKYQISKNETSNYIYKHTYNENNKIIQTIEYENSKPIHRTEYIYKEGILIRRNEYETDTYRGKFKNKNLEEAELFTLIKVHTYAYCKGELKEEKVCLPSGVVSYYKVYERGQVELLNPFYMKPQWTLDSIEDETFGITIKEKELTSEIVHDIVHSLHDNYSSCRWIIIDAFSAESIPEEDGEISILLKQFESNWNIRVDFG